MIEILEDSLKSPKTLQQLNKFDIAYMKTAQAIAELSHDYKTKVGCVLVKDKRIISTGYNGTPTGTNNKTRDKDDETLHTVIHAELNALLHAGVDVKGASMYVTLAPCIRCAAHMKTVGIKKIYYGYHKKTNAEQWEALIWGQQNGMEIIHADITRVSSEKDTTK